MGAGTAIACGDGGVGPSEGTRDCSGVGLGLFSGFGVSLASAVPFALPFAVFFGVGDAFFFRVDFFFPAFAFGVGLGDFFAFSKAVVGSGVSLGFGLGLLSSSSDFFAAFAFPIRGLGDSSGPADAPVSSFDLCSTRFAFAIGLGDLLGVGDEMRCVVCRFSGDSSRLASSSLLTCARRRLPTIALSASVVASQRRKRTTAAERNRARGAINRECALVANPSGVQSQAGRAAAVPRAVLSRMRSRSRRRIAFNFPPRSRSKQVKYIQVSSTIIDANAR